MLKANETNGDYIADLGYAVLPHHIRRLLDSLFKREGELAAGHALTAPVRTHSMMRLLAGCEHLCVGDVVERLKLSRPLIVNFADKLTALGLVREERPQHDRRIRLLSLTDDGRGEVERIEAFHRDTEEEYRALGEALGVDLLGLVTDARTWLDDRPGQSKRIQKEEVR